MLELHASVTLCLCLRRLCSAEAIYYIFTMFCCLFVRSPDVPCQHGLVRRKGESITNLQLWRHHVTAGRLIYGKIY